MNEYEQVIVERLAGLEEQMRGALKRIDEQKRLTESVYDLASSVKVLTLKLDSTEKTVASLRGDVDELKAKPSKRWDSLIMVLLTAAVTAVVTYVCTGIGIK